MVSNRWWNRAAVFAVCAAVPAVVFGLIRVLRTFDTSTLAFVIGVETAIGFIGLMVFNPRVGYRRRDIGLLLVPVYGVVYLVRVLSRAAHLPNAYWRASIAGSELYRYASFAELVAVGSSRRAADLAALALFPLDDDVPAGEEFAEQLKAQAIRFAEAVRTTPVEDLEILSVETLEKYIELAAHSSEHYYAARFGSVVDAGRADAIAAASTFNFRESAIQRVAVAQPDSSSPRID
jgi:hypothetical protein